MSKILVNSQVFDETIKIINQKADGIDTLRGELQEISNSFLDEFELSCNETIERRMNDIQGRILIQYKIFLDDLSSSIENVKKEFEDKDNNQGRR